MENKIKELRKQIDGISQLVKDSNTDFIGGSSQMDKSYNSLILSKAWLGKCLAELGIENPYKSGYKTKEDIEPTADVSLPITLVKQLNTTKPIGASIVEMNHIEKVDWLRTEIEIYINYIKEIDIKSTREFAIARTNSYNYLCEAKFWLGFELQRIKENK